MTRLLPVIALLCASQAGAHEWYPPACCNQNDCKPVPVEGVSIVPGGYMIDATGEFIAHEDAEISPDGQYHRCEKVDGSTRVLISGMTCFWAPPVGS